MKGGPPTLARSCFLCTGVSSLVSAAELARYADLVAVADQASLNMHKCWSIVPLLQNLQLPAVEIWRYHKRPDMVCMISELQLQLLVR